MMIPVQHRTTYTVTLAEENGRLRYDKALLLRQIEAIQSGLQDGTADLAYRALLRTVAFMREESSR